MSEFFTRTLKNLFALTNRGMLLDVFVFLLNLFLMRLLSANFIGLIQDTGAGDSIAAFALFLFCLGILILPPLGATLKRWRYHQRRGFRESDAENPKLGCLFNPILFFCLNIVIYACVNAFVFQYFYGNKEPNGAFFVSSMLFGIIFVIFQTVIVYRYFSPPKDKPPVEFLRSPQSELIGDVCIFLNMILFQLVWNVLTGFSLDRVSNLNDLAGRIFFITFIALLIYFPPRIFYLAEDIVHRRVWLTMLLANSPVIWRIVIGSN